MCAGATVMLLGSCSIFKKKYEKSSVTGWDYNNPKWGGFYVAKNKEQQTGPGLVFVQGGTFTMGATEQDVMYQWNNIPRRVTVSSFYIDETEVANVHYREYLFWLNRVFGQTYPQVYLKALPDTLVWRSELAYNEPLVEYYFRHPAYNYYPVVGVNWEQASDFCKWRSDRVNEKLLIDAGILSMQDIDNEQADNVFTTSAYLAGLYEGTPGKMANSRKSPYRNPDGTPRNVTFEDGLLLPNYRLPTEAEWEYAALAYIGQNPNPSRKEGKRGEELIMNREVYPWSINPTGLRDQRRGNFEGQFLANFKRGLGDNMGVAGGLNDRASIPAPVKSYYPNAFGIYNMAGNVSEWVADVYRQLTPLDADGFNYFRGNVFMDVYRNAQGEFEKDSLGRLKRIIEPDSIAEKRLNYQRADVRNYDDGDSLSGASYQYGITSLINNQTRVIKGGSWNDLPYWLSPGTRRYMQQTMATNTVGFRCAMDRVGSQEGNGFRTGNYFRQPRQKR
ncbi:MAG: SUMF1/EgtB/PvdO family nonheme iron enzyme [Thermoflavifilum sp.]|nr:SUMF1/EgtB/PvdO family nonheme iron enzyme [Thermoflavifilum sp.]